jgi:hypothetical protein
MIFEVTMLKFGLLFMVFDTILQLRIASFWLQKYGCRNIRMLMFVSLVSLIFLAYLVSLGHVMSIKGSVFAHGRIGLDLHKNELVYILIIWMITKQSEFNI